MIDSSPRPNGCNKFPGSLGAPSNRILGEDPSPHWLLLLLIVSRYMPTDISSTGTPSSNASKLNVFQASSCGTARTVVTLVAPAGSSTSCVSDMRLYMPPQPPGRNRRVIVRSAASGGLGVIVTRTG